jgi:hypothetical protein
VAEVSENQPNAQQGMGGFSAWPAQAWASLKLTSKANSQGGCREAFSAIINAK